MNTKKKNIEHFNDTIDICGDMANIINNKLQPAIKGAVNPIIRFVNDVVHKIKEIMQKIGTGIDVSTIGCIKGINASIDGLNEAKKVFKTLSNLLTLLTPDDNPIYLIITLLIVQYIPPEQIIHISFYRTMAIYLFTFVTIIFPIIEFFNFFELWTYTFTVFWDFFGNLFYELYNLVIYCVNLYYN